MTRVAEHLGRHWADYAAAVLLFGVPVAHMLDVPPWATASIWVGGLVALISVGTYCIRDVMRRR
jgi:hypothetical protein